MSTEMKSYSLTENDFYLITRTLRKLAENTNMGTIKDDAQDLINYLEAEKKNHETESV